jgi:hypothetical protein
MGLLQVIFHWFGLVISTYFEAGTSAVDLIASGMREPLSHFGMSGAMQTFLLAMVPILTIVATVKLLNGAVRMMVVLSMLGALFHLTWPLVDDFVGIV